jgi:hypothetical protein
MQVRITNVTDGPGKKPAEVRVYNKRLRPGAWMDVPVQFVDEKVRKLETAGVIIIGKLPPWYADYEAKRKVRNLTADEVAANVEAKKAKAKKDAAKNAPPAPVPPAEETTQPKKFVALDDLVVAEESVEITTGEEAPRGRRLKR